MADPYKRDRRLGRWSIAGRAATDDMAAMLLLQDRVVIRDVRFDHTNDRVEYVGQSEHFDIVPAGCVVPLYVPAVHVVNNEPQSVTWHRVPDVRPALRAVSA